MKKIIAVLLGVITVFTFTVTVFASNNDADFAEFFALLEEYDYDFDRVFEERPDLEEKFGSDYDSEEDFTSVFADRTYSSVGAMTKVIDEQDVFTPAQEADLTEKINKYVDELNFDIGIITADVVGDITTYTDSRFIGDLFGVGSGGDGALFLFDVNEHKYHVSTHGKGIDYMSDVVLDAITVEIEEMFKEDNYYGGADYFVEKTADCARAGNAGKPLDKKDVVPFNWLKNILISLAVGFIAAYLIARSMKGKLTSVRNVDTAADYVKPGSLKVTGGNEIFLYHTVTATPKPKETSHSGGGSSTHSTGGSSFGGKSGSW